MVDLPLPRVPISIKRRSVSAIRDFPKGCGNKVRLSRPPPVELDSNLKNADAASEASTSFKVPKIEPGDDELVSNAGNGPMDGEKRSAVVVEGAKSCYGQLEEVQTSSSKNLVSGEAKGLRTTGLLEEGQNSGFKGLGNGEVKEMTIEGVKSNGLLEEGQSNFLKALVNGEIEGMAVKSNGHVNGDVKEKLGILVQSKFPGLKRRKVSAVRDFPFGCGRAASKICKMADSRVEPVASSESNVLGEGCKLAVVSGDKAEDEVRTNGDREGRDLVVGESNEKVKDGVSSGKKHEGVVKRNGSNQIKVKEKEGSVIKSPRLKGLGEEEKPLGKLREPKESSGSVSSSGVADYEIEVNSIRMICEDMKPVAKDKAAVGGSAKVSPVKSVGTEAKDNDTVKIRQSSDDGSSEVRIKSHVDRKSILDNHNQKKMLTQKVSKKLEGQDEKPVSKNFQFKELRDTENLSDIKAADKGGKSFEKPLDKGSTKIPNDVKNFKRKLLELDEGKSVEDCPWRKERKPSYIVPPSKTLKVKEKKVKRLWGSNPASVSGTAASSLHKSRMDVEKKDSLSQDGGNRKALARYDRSEDLHITMTPSVPFELLRSSGSSEAAVRRNMVKRTLRMFQLICRKLVQGEEKSKGKLISGGEASSKGNSKNRIDLEAAKILKNSNEWVNHGEAIIGHVPGVEVGDEFHYRVELSIIGLHRPFQGGIDFTKKDGMVLATSIVASGGYPDDIDSSDVLIYSGSGGIGSGDKQAGDQKLERGNLALKNSIDAKTPVRVVYGSKEAVKSNSLDGKSKQVATFTYDGLYNVEKSWIEKGNKGFNVFKFQLRKQSGQPEIALKEIKKTKKSKVREGLCVKDISDGMESMPICAINTVDCDRPMPFKYITKVRYPSWYVKRPPRGCDCKNGCIDSQNCACAVKNGGEIPFNFNGAIVQAKPLVYECGPSCKCPPSCYNRVSQRGIQIQLEIFKTGKRGWGVRSICSIPSGAFVCEYIGEMLDEADAEQRNNDEYLFDIGNNYDDQTLWEGLPSCIPGLQSDADHVIASETDRDACFTIDAAKCGNVARFINHSCSPNLYAQNLLYDHDDKKMPHVMFFAIDNIPPLQELTYHYNYGIDQVRDSAGNIKVKQCLCGSPECTGRLY